jgi:ADP-ribosyl-[dinitrogen reductase] hydrolase
MKKKSGVLIALAVGDSLGMQFETRNWNDPAILAWNGHSYGSSEFHKLGPGQWTDDTGMSLALTETLINTYPGLSYYRGRGYYPEIAARSYLNWYQGPTFRGAGQTTRKALENLKNDVPWYESGELGALGNGTAMRVAPLGVFYKDEPSKLIKAAKLDAIITHDSHEAQQGSIAIAMGVSLLLNGVKKEEIFESLRHVLAPSRLLDAINLTASNKVIHDTLKNKDYNRDLDRNGDNRIISQLILGNKYTVIESVARSFYVFVATRSFEEAMELAIRGGGDCDTVGAMTGALCVAYYGLEGIPENYITSLEDHDRILKLDEELIG